MIMRNLELEYDNEESSELEYDHEESLRLTRMTVLDVQYSI